MTRTDSRSLRRWAALMLLAVLVPALACNLPVRPVATTELGPPKPGVEQSVQQTLAAGLFATALPGQTLAPTPVPGLPVVTVVGTPETGQTGVTTGGSPAVLKGDTWQYITQPGDTVAELAGRFGVEPAQIIDPMKFPPQMQLPSGQMLAISNTIGDPPYPGLLLPDTEVMYSPAVLNFSVEDFVRQAGGFLSTYTEQTDTGLLTGAQIVTQVAQDTSINPRLLLAILEYRSGWVFSVPDHPNTNNPIGFYAKDFNGLLPELTLAARQLTLGYYGWRSGKLTNLEFVNKSLQRIHPGLNPGSVAIQYLFTKLYLPIDWQGELYNPARFLAFYRERFGDPWQRAAAAGPELPDGLTQPVLELPFPVGEKWTLTGGPHEAWGVGSPWGAVDFAPANVEPGCTVSAFWATAAAPGLVIRSDRGQVIIDLDGDGHEETGWVLLYLHIAAKDQVAAGTYVNLNDRIGHPSCEGGKATGTHVHISRKYNGEWLSVDGPVPFVLSGWTVFSGERAYSGSLVKGDQIVTARPDGTQTSLISR
jgi:LasA protease